MQRTPESRPFEHVWRIVLQIPRGRVATYGQISELIGRRLTPIGIGWAIRAVPEGALPWHRVVNASGGVSTDREHPGLQRALLEAEGVRFDARGCIDLERFGWRPRRTQRTSKKTTATKGTKRSKRTPSPKAST
jgi:methylated-DNA-protein-cysteine methyltransferase-like protein